MISNHLIKFSILNFKIARESINKDEFDLYAVGLFDGMLAEFYMDGDMVFVRDYEHFIKTNPPQFFCVLRKEKQS